MLYLGNSNIAYMLYRNPGLLDFRLAFYCLISEFTVHRPCIFIPGFNFPLKLLVAIYLIHKAFILFLAFFYTLLQAQDSAHCSLPF